MGSAGLIINLHNFSIHRPGCGPLGWGPALTSQCTSCKASSGCGLAGVLGGHCSHLYLSPRSLGHETLGSGDRTWLVECLSRMRESLGWIPVLYNIGQGMAALGLEVQRQRGSGGARL